MRSPIAQSLCRLGLAVVFAGFGTGLAVQSALAQTDTADSSEVAEEKSEIEILDWPKFIKGKREYQFLESHQRLEGNHYFFMDRVDVNGTVAGDLFMGGAILSIEKDGLVEGDLLGFASSMEIDGVIKGDARIAASTCFITGRIEGDVLYTGGQLTIAPDAVILGEVRGFAANLKHSGTIGGDLVTKGGMLRLNGVVEKNVSIEFDSIELRSQAKVLGDFYYEARKLDIDKETLESVVDGEIQLKKKEPKEEKVEEKPFFSPSRFLKLFRNLVWAFLCGAAYVFLVGRNRDKIQQTLQQDPFISLLVGIAATLMLPLVGIILTILFVTLPIGILIFTLSLFLIYLGKLPVAYWIGNKLLSRSSRPLKLLKLFIGLLLLYILFSVPYVGFIAWITVTVLGFGCIALTVMRYASSVMESEPLSEG